MILAIDIGNTNIVLGCMEHDRILVEARMATDLLKTSDQYCVELKNLLNLYEIDPKSVEARASRRDSISRWRTRLRSAVI